jgi:hypothetical protein
MCDLVVAMVVPIMVTASMTTTWMTVASGKPKSYTKIFIKSFFFLCFLQQVRLNLNTKEP